MLLQLNNVHKTFIDENKNKVKAIDNVSFNLNFKENLGLVGESGCGKTTLARCIIKLYKVDSGEIIFDGQNITKIKDHKFRPVRKYIQMVFQDPYSSLDPRFTVREILKEAMSLDEKRYKSDSEKEQRMLDLLQEVEMKGDLLNRFPHEFSGGERQRIAIARALILNPKLLILDEAVSSLDVLVQGQILKLLNEIQKTHDITYLFISHNLKVVKQLCDNIAVMYKGKIVELGSCEDIFYNPLHPYTKKLLKAAIEYKSSSDNEEIMVPTWGQLTEKTKGHFVIGK